MGDIENLEKLIDEHSSINYKITDERKNNAIHFAVANGHLNIIKMLRNRLDSQIFKDLVNQQNWQGNTPAH